MHELLTESMHSSNNYPGTKELGFRMGKQKLMHAELVMSVATV